VTLRWLPRFVVLTTLLGTSGWVALDRDPADRLPICDAAAGASHHSPAAPPSLSGDACRARPTSIQRVRAVPRPATATSTALTPNPYHHLGATSSAPWSGVLGRITVRDPGVREQSLDFTAARFMARRDGTDGATSWLEAGWAETGWSGGGKQRIYTYDTNRNAWTFFEDYAIHDGDQIWIYIEASAVSDQPQTGWLAWLWWGDKWHLLADQRLPLTSSAVVEQYVEVYADAKRVGGYSVPPVSFDNVQVKENPGGEARFWREDEVAATTGDGTGAYCLNWVTRFDTWSAGDCP